MRIVPHSHFAAPAIRLDAEAETNLCGRGGFYIHGGTNSEGCILVQLSFRRVLAGFIGAGWDRLRVVE